MRATVKIAIAVVFVFAIGGAALAGLSAGRTRVPAGGTGSAPVAGRAPTTDDQIAALQSRISTRQPNSQSYVALGYLYFQKVRESADPSFYAKSEAAFRKAQELNPNDADSYAGLGSITLARHDFAEALAYGQRARALNPFKASALGVIADAFTELGRYEEAQAAVQEMRDLRPGLTTYTRASYQRELRGDLATAATLMEQAMDAARAGTEGYEWTHVQLGNLYLLNGEIDRAEREYNHSLFNLPNYMYARAGLARIKAMRGDYDGAAAIYQDIVRVMPVSEFAIALVDVQRAAGKTTEMQASIALVGVIDQLQRANGIRTDLEMSLFKADNDIDPEATVEQARVSLETRPSVHGYDALAWALYKVGRFEEAQAASDQALRLGSADPMFRYHAAKIADALGQPERARSELRAATTRNPNFSVRYAADAAAMLKRLDATAGVSAAGR